MYNDMTDRHPRRKRSPFPMIWITIQQENSLTLQWYIYGSQSNKKTFSVIQCCLSCVWSFWSSLAHYHNSFTKKTTLHITEHNTPRWASSETTLQQQDNSTSFLSVFAVVHKCHTQYSFSTVSLRIQVSLYATDFKSTLQSVTKFLTVQSLMNHAHQSVVQVKWYN